MARTAGHTLNRQAWADLLACKGVSLTDVAKTSGVPRSTLSSLLGGFTRASVGRAHRIAAALDCNPATLFPTLSPAFTSTLVDDTEEVA